jgi:hypothetical protein
MPGAACMYEDSHTSFAVKHDGAVNKARSDSLLSPEIGATHRYLHEVSQVQLDDGTGRSSTRFVEFWFTP